MLKWTKRQKQVIAGFGIAILLTVVMPLVPYLHGTQSFLFGAIVMAWGFLIRQRILNPMVRTQLVIASVYMFLLFFVRMIKWVCFPNNLLVSEYCWYIYYFSYSMVPLCMFFAVLCIGKTKEEQPLRHVKWLYLVQFGIAALALTNGFHQLFFRYVDRRADIVEYGGAYYFTVVWGGGLCVMTLAMIFRQSRAKGARKLWFVPVTGMLFGAALMAIYYVCKGSPSIGGVNVYAIQEAFCITFILPFECMIQLGILPNNSRYEELFEGSEFSAAILEDDGTIAFTSRRMPKETEDPCIRRIVRKIHGGNVICEEDLTAINRISSEIQKATEQLEEENDLIRQENEIRSERISYEIKNRLYDKIAGALRGTAVRINELIMDEEEEGFTGRLHQATVFGAYVKRMGNLMLIAEETDRISTKELGNCVRESLEYFELAGNLQSFVEKGERLLPARLALMAYELFEMILETPDKVSTIILWLDAREGFLFRISFDAKEQPVDGQWRKEELARYGAVLRTEYADDAWRVTLTAPGGKDDGVANEKDDGAARNAARPGEEGAP